VHLICRQCKTLQGSGWFSLTLQQCAPFDHGFIRPRPNELVNENDRYDYMLQPKQSGYRGIHDVYKYRAKTDSGAYWNGLQIELQYRTLVQHAWATSVELSDALTANRTKFSQGSADNTRFFQICSELLARRYEGSHSCLATASHVELVDEWYDIESRAQLFHQLKSVGGQRATPT
jgi:putative GTP pyrophosphokinase